MALMTTFNLNETFMSNQTLGNALNNTTNIEQLLIDKLGPRRKDLVSAVLLTIVYSIIFVSGMVGNICTCLVITRTHAMQTTTNYYLFSLAVSDLLLIFFGLPPELCTIWEAYPWRLGEAFCYVRQSVLEATSYASVLTITAFTVERYLAICHPLLAHKIQALSRAVKIIIVIWIVSFVVALPYAIHTRVYYGVYDPETNEPVPDSLVCSIPYHFLSGFMYYMFQVSTFLFFIGPVTVIIILYILIGIALHRSPLARAASDERTYSSMKSSSSLSHQQQQPRKVVIRMLIAVTVAFIVCWAPFHTQRLMILYVPHWTPHLLAVQSHIFYISGVLYFVSSTVNPILYNVISKRYRAAFKQIICPCCHTKPTNANHSMARQSERFSKSQAMVVLKNGNESLRVVFRQEPHEPALNYETIPLNGAAKHRSGAMEDDDVMRCNVAAENFSSSSSSGSAEFVAPTPPHKKFVCGKGACSRTSLKHAHELDKYVIKNRGAGRELCFLSQNKAATEALKKAEKPRKSYAHQVNGRVSFKTTPESCDCGSNNGSVVR